jgi:putative membrane-bound dehydrogenase-like protein
MNKSTALAGGLVAIVLASLAFPHSREQAPASDQVLTVPEGFEVERVAGPPLVDRPIVADFDEAGRLYVADSSGSNDKVEQQLAEKPHRIVRLEDTNGDGRFDRRVVFADRMMFPEGAMWFDGSLYVAAPPSIWKLTDTDDDGVADRREEWFQGKTLTGCANDLHGPYLGPDGWIYWTKGAFAQQTYERPGKPPFVTKAAHIFRRRPGDAVVEPVMTGGMDNPVDVAFTPAGERILTATFLEHPQLGRRDALIHAVYGGLYGKPHAVIDGHTRTGDLMPELTAYGPAAPAGLTRYASRVFGDEYRDNFFAVMFNLHKVTRHALQPNGATFESRDSDFLVSSSLDFHPTDVLEDADGSLLVIDTGAWYKLCCPTSQLAKPDVLGAIYRVRKKGAAPVSDPRGLRLAWNTLKAADLAGLLDDPRPAVQHRVLHQLAKLREEAVGPLEEKLNTPASVEARRNAVWALTRIETGPARAAVRSALNDRDESVRQAAAHSAGLWRDGAAVSPLVEALKSGRPAVQRAAAEALGRIGDSRAVPELLAIAATAGEGATMKAGAADRVLEHSLTYALIEIADPAATAAGLQAASSAAKRAALIAIDQMDGGGLKPEAAVALLDSPDRVIKDTAWWIAGHHPEWGAELARYFEERLSARSLGARERDELQQRLVSFGENGAIQELLAAMAGRGAPEERVIGFRAMARTRAKELPAAWVAPLVVALNGREPALMGHAMAVLRAAPPPKAAIADLHAALLGIARDRAVDEGLRLGAMAAMQGGLARVEPGEFELLRSSLEPDRPASVRAAAASVLETARLDRDQLFTLAGSLETAGPMEVPRLLPAFDNGSDEALGLRMLAALGRSAGRSSVRPEILRPRLAKYPAPVQKRGETLLASLNVDSAKQAQRLEELLADIGGGDVRRGQAVFNSQKTACMACHAVGYLGGKIGPDLTRIGQVRSERDLLEAIVYPSASFARSYEPVVVSTTSGATHSGVLRSDRPDELVLTTSAGEETRIARQDVDEVVPGTISIMPPGLADQLSRQELADLIAFLKATRPGAQ